MRLYPGKVDTIAAEIITSLTTAGDIEVSDGNEAQLDCAAVLKEYIRVDKELTERAKDILEIRGLPYSHLGRTKRQLADQKEFGLGEEGLSWISNQMLEAFMNSRHIDEVFAEDVVLRRKIKDICKKHMMVDANFNLVKTTEWVAGLCTQQDILLPGGLSRMRRACGAVIGIKVCAPCDDA